MLYLVKEFDQGEEIKCTMHLVTDEGDETNDGSIWKWVRRAARCSASISVYKVGAKVYAVGRVGPFDRFLVIDGRSEARELSIVWPNFVQPFLDMQERGEPVTICPTQLVLDLS